MRLRKPNRFEIPELLSYGSFLKEESTFLYMILKRVSTLSLEDYFESKVFKLPQIEIMKIAVDIVQGLRSIHKMGYVYNGLSLDSLHIVKTKNQNTFVETLTNVLEIPTKITQVQLTDFKRMTKFQEKVTDENGVRNFKHLCVSEL